MIGYACLALNTSFTAIALIDYIYLIIIPDVKHTPFATYFAVAVLGVVPIILMQPFIDMNYKEARMSFL
jgi:hypothetical protein